MKNTLKLTKIIVAKMSKELSEIRFRAARNKLSSSLKDLEKTMISKLQEIALSAEILGANEDGNNDVIFAKTTIIEQNATIQNLNAELNKLQKTLAEAGRESEFFTEKNKLLADKIAQFRSQSLSLVEAVESDLASISEIIKIEE